MDVYGTWCSVVVGGETTEVRLSRVDRYQSREEKNREGRVSEQEGARGALAVFIIGKVAPRIKAKTQRRREEAGSRGLSR